MSDKQATTMDDIAMLSGVSKPTVSRALSGSPLVNEKTREHVLAIARKHGYAVNRNAQKLRNKRTNTIGVSIDFRSHRKSHISDPFMFELLAGVSEALGDLNQDLLLTAPNHNDLEAFQQIQLSRGADGFIFLGQGQREPMIEAFANSGAPLVVWGAERQNTNYCVVGSDNLLGGELAGRHFLALGRRKMLFIGDCSHSEIHARYSGLKGAVKSAKTEVDLIQPVNFSYESAVTAIEEYIQTNAEIPDAIFAHSDSAAMACIQALKNKGLSLPKDVSIIGYNDIPSAAYFTPPITTVRQDTFQAGALLVKKLMAIINGEHPASETINTELVVRET